MKIHLLRIAVSLFLILLCSCTTTSILDRPLHIAPASDECSDPDGVLLIEPLNGDSFYVDPIPVISMEHVIEATAEEDTFGPSVLIVLDEEGTTLLGELTAARVGDRIAIVVNGELMSAPVVQEAVTQGMARITGVMTMEEAEALASALTP